MLKFGSASRLVTYIRPQLQRWMSTTTSKSNLSVSNGNSNSAVLRSMRNRLRELSSDFEKTEVINKEFKQEKHDKRSPISRSVENIVEQIILQIEALKRKFPDSDLSAEITSAIHLVCSTDTDCINKLQSEPLGRFIQLVVRENINTPDWNDLVSGLLSKCLPKFLAKKEQPSVVKFLCKVFHEPNLFSRFKFSGSMFIEGLEAILSEDAKLKVQLETILSDFLTISPELQPSDRQKLRTLVDTHLLKSGWSDTLGVLLFQRGYMTFRLFKYWLIEIYKLTPETDLSTLSSTQRCKLGLEGPLEWAKLLRLNELHFLTFTDLPSALNPALGEEKRETELGSKEGSLGSPLLLAALNPLVLSQANNKFQPLLHGKYGPSVYGMRVISDRETTTMNSEILTVLYNNPKGELILTLPLEDLLGLVHTSVDLLGSKEAKLYWTQHLELLKSRMQNMHQDFGVVLEGSYLLFSSPFLIRNIYAEYLKSLKTFLDSQLAPQHYTDTKYSAWKRGFSEVAYLADTLLPLAEKTSSGADQSEFIGHQMHVSKLISDALIDPIMHPEFENELDKFYVLTPDDEKVPIDSNKREQVNSRMSESARARKGQISPSGKKAEVAFKSRPTNLLETEQLWKDFERIVKVNTSFLDKWDQTTLRLFTDTMNKMIRSGMATKKFVIAGIRVFEHFLPKMDSLQILSLVRLLIDVNFLTDSLKEALEHTLKTHLKTEFIPTLLKKLGKVEYFESLIDICYFCALNKFYNQEMWNSLVYGLDITALEADMAGFSSQSLIKLGHSVLLTRMEASYIRTATLDRIMPYLTSLSQMEFDLFQSSKFSDDVGQLLRKYYYDYLKQDETAELFKVHFLQEKHVILCLDHEHFLVNSGILKGQTATAIRLLKGLGYEVHIVSRRRYNYQEKRSVRLEYLRENLKGIAINEKRKLEVETSPAHEY